MAWNCHLYFCFFPRGQVMERGAWWLGRRMCAIRCAARIHCHRAMQICLAKVANSSSLRMDMQRPITKLISVVRSETLVTTFDHIHLQNGLSLLSSHLNWVCSSNSLRYVNQSTLKKKREFTDQNFNFCCIFSLVIYYHWYEKVCHFFSIVIIFSLEGLFLPRILVLFFFYRSKQNIVGMVHKKSIPRKSRICNSFIKEKFKMRHFLLWWAVNIHTKKWS